LAIASAAALAPMLHSESPTAIKGQYIVVLHPNATSQQLVDFKLSVQGRLAAAAGRNEFLFTETVEIREFKAVLAAIEDEQLLLTIRNNPLVKYVEQDQTVSIDQTCETQETALWNLDRISETILDLDGYYHYPGDAGEGSDVYILDTGIYLQHNGFEGRAIFGWSAFPSQPGDGNGHGTHVSGTVGGAPWGVAKKVTLIDIKVLGNNGSGSWTGVISGVGQTTSLYQQRGNPATANMSLGGGISTAVDDAVKQSIAAGVTYAVAAGNSNANACNYSPANVREAITAGSTTSTDARSSFSNFGTCVDVFAPGSTVTSAWIGNPNAINTISGTSMASPHVAGVAALIYAEFPAYTPAQVKNLLQARATNGLVINPGNGSPNLLLYTSCVEGTK